MPRYIIDTHFFNPKIFDTTDDAYLDGYWKTEKYFPDNKEATQKYSHRVFHLVKAQR